VRRSSVRRTPEPRPRGGIPGGVDFEAFSFVAPVKAGGKHVSFVPKGVGMRKRIVHEFMSLDGVVQAPGGQDEDRDGASSMGLDRPILAR
jgi:hypothetical protein